MNTFRTAIRERQKRRFRRLARNRVRGTPERPRVAVFRSNRHIGAQIIDDTVGKTLVAASSLEKDLRGTLKHFGNVSATAEVARRLAQRAIRMGIREVVFDRRWYMYHGRVKAFADELRKGGLSF